MTTTTPETFTEPEITVLSCCSSPGGFRKADFSDPYRKQAFADLKKRGLLIPSRFGNGLR